MSPHERLGALSPFADNRLERLAFVPIPARAYLPRRPRYEGQASIRRYRWPNRRIVQEVRILAATRHLQLPSRSTGRGTDLDELLEIGRATSELQSLMRISYAVFCLKKKTIQYKTHKT